MLSEFLRETVHGRPVAISTSNAIVGAHLGCFYAIIDFAANFPFCLGRFLHETENMKYKRFRILGAGPALIGIGLPLSTPAAPSKTSPSPSVSPRPVTTMKVSPTASPASSAA